jgi:hypothetical protein
MCVIRSGAVIYLPEKLNVLALPFASILRIDLFSWLMKWIPLTMSMSECGIFTSVA